MKKKILLSLLVIVAAAGIWAIFNREKATQAIVDLGMALTSSIKHRDPGAEKAKFQISSDDLAKAFQNNLTEANKQYINQAVLVNGNITAIAGFTVSLNNVACNIDSAAVNQLDKLKTGDQVKIQGLVVGYNDLMGEVTLAQCRFK